MHTSPPPGMDPRSTPFVPAAALPVERNHWTLDHGVARLAFHCERPHVRVIDNLLTHAECDALIEAASARLQRAQVIDSDHGGERLDERRTSELVTYTRGATPFTSLIERRISAL